MPELVLMQLNALDLYAASNNTDHARWGRVHELIRRHRPTVLAVQELIARRDDGFGRSMPDAELAAQRLGELAEAVGMRHRINSAYGKPIAAVAVAETGYHTALLWQEGVEPVTGTWRSQGRPSGLWHALAALVLDFGGPTLGFMSFHWSPFSSVLRAQEAAILVSAMVAMGPCLAAGDANQQGSDVLVDGEGQRHYYDDSLADPPLAAYQAVVAGDPLAGTDRLVIDRAPAQVVRDAGGMTDAAVHLKAPWQATIGHWPQKRKSVPQRIDHVLASPGAVPTLRFYRVDNSELARSASDHLPVLVGFDPTARQPE